jgi:hypothetical protein
MDVCNVCSLLSMSSSYMSSSDLSTCGGVAAKCEREEDHTCEGFNGYVCLATEIAAAAATRSFSFVNECPHEVWVGTQANGGIRLLAEGGFALAAGQKMTLDQVEAGWGGRFWGRTGCTFDAHGRGSCETGDCGGFLKCAGAGGEPPASLAEFTLNGANGDDFYDVSLVDGYNLEIRITPTGGNGTCGSPGCTSNLNTQCPTSLQVVSCCSCCSCCCSCFFSFFFFLFFLNESSSCQCDLAEAS